MKRVLVTGAAGFIGCHLARRLTDASDVHLTLVDNLQRGEIDTDFKAVRSRPNVAFLKIDLTIPAQVAVLGEYGDFDEVYHLAAANGTKIFYDAPAEVLRTNSLSTIHLLDWIVTLPTKPRLMFTSSNEAYAGALAAFGQLPIPTPEDVPLVIHDPYNPRWSYAATKLIGELFVIHYAKCHGIPSVIVRPHNFYGPRAGRDHVIPELIARIEARQDPFALYGADETRTFCYIDDAVDAMVRLMGCASIEAPTVHIGAADEIAMRDLALLMFHIAEWDPKEIDEKPSLPGSVLRRLANTDRIRKMIGWQAQTPLNVGLRRSYQWYRAALNRPPPSFTGWD